MKTIREETHGKATLRLLDTGKDYAGIIIAKGGASTPIRGDDPDELWLALLRDAGQSNTGYFGFDGAKARFLRVFPGGFASAAYRSRERDYKDAARTLLLTHLPIDKARSASAEACAAAARVYAKTNMLSQFEQARVHQLLKSAEGPDFLRGAVLVADGDFAAGLTMMEKSIRPYGQPSWPAATYLPFFWKPTEHMFLKPQVTRDFAERVGHPFGHDYRSALSAGVYGSLLDLAKETQMSIAHLEPVDRIDVQSFIWTVGAYPDEEASPS